VKLHDQLSLLISRNSRKVRKFYKEITSDLMLTNQVESRHEVFAEGPVLKYRLKGLS
jgi:hypothetical protein